MINQSFEIFSVIFTFTFDVDTTGLRGGLIIACLETPVQLVFLEILIDLPRDDINEQITGFLCLQFPCIAQCCIFSQK